MSDITTRPWIQRRPRRKAGPRAIVLRPPLLPPYGTFIPIAYLAYVCYLLRPLLVGDLRWEALLHVVSLALIVVVPRALAFRLELGSDGMTWGNAAAGISTASWDAIERIDIDPYSETATLRPRRGGSAMSLPIELLSFDDALTALSVWTEHGVLASPEEAPSPPRGSTATILPWNRRAIHPGMLAIYVLALCGAFVGALLGALLGAWIAVVLSLVVTFLVLPRFWFRAFRVDGEGIHARTWPRTTWRMFAWRDIASVHGGTEARPLRVRTFEGAWHKTGAVLERSEFLALRSQLRERSAEAVFA